MNRRLFLRAFAMAGLGPLAGCGTALPPGELHGTAFGLGHRLRDQGFPPPARTERVPVLIVGAGIAGLSAGWTLARAGFADFLMVELESGAGGNARAGHNAVSDYPLGAHYLPLPNPEATAVRALLSELGVLEGDPRAERPRYDERYLCAVPQERLYRNGWWEDGLLPLLGVGAAERAQYQRFQALMDGFRDRRDGNRRAFALPMEGSSPAADLQALDAVTMRDWLLAQGFDSAHLHWYVDYCCRDDYGTGSAEVSAWAGIHYFAARAGEGQDTGGDAVFTTPGGNAWLAEGLAGSIRARVGERLRCGALAFRVAEAADGLAVDCWLPDAGRTLRLTADQLIWAAPLFPVPQVFAGHADLRQAAGHFTHAPWLIANLTLSHPPATRAGAPLAWDNVLYDSPGLGYVVATHQQWRMVPGATVLTYYRALSEITPAQGRALLLNSPREVWAGQVLADLERAHPDIRRLTTRLDCFRNGHAMVRPLPGLIWGEPRRLLAADHGRLRFAHADLSGLSLFEEAQYRGVLAAERTLDRLGRPYTTCLV